MNRRIALILAILISAVSACSYAVVVDKILVVVNNEVITQGELDRILGPAYQQYKSALAGEQLIRKLDEARQAVMAQLIEEKLILSEAKRQNIEVEEKDINAKLAEARKRFPLPEQFEEALAAQRMTLKELKTKFKEQLMTKKLLDQKVGTRVFITPAEIVDYYNSHIQQFSTPEQIKLSNILIKPKDNVKVEKTVELVTEISKRLKAGGDFGELAKIYSEGPGAGSGGSMGYVKRGDLMPEIEKIVFNLKVGEVTDVIRTPIGFHFFKLEEVKPSQTITIDEARRSIEETLWMAKMKDKSRGWIEDLRKHAYIAFK